MKRNKNKRKFMRRIIYILLAFMVLGCQKEDALKSNLEYERLYVIEDDPSDPVKHRVYEIYQQYNVPVYFNDTIGRLFVKNDVYGNPVYRYETLDLSWGITSYSSLKYSYEYMTDPTEQLKALDLIEEYLKIASKALYPFNFFVTKSVRTKDNQGKIETFGKGTFRIYIRSLLMTGDWMDGADEVLPGSMMREMVKNKIMNYKDLLVYFNSVSKPEWYGVFYSSLNPNHFEDLVSPNEFEWNGYGGVPPMYYFSPGCFSDTWYAVNEFTETGLEKFRAAVRVKIGKFGFISSGDTGTSTPNKSEDDLNAYISEMLKWSPEEFAELWGECPLVMEKYSILYKIVAEELGVKL